MGNEDNIMDAETFHTFQKACCNGQFATFLNTVKTIDLKGLQEPVLRNMWLFYSGLLTQLFEDKKVSATKLKSFAKNSNALGELFLALPLTTHAFWSLQALTGFYKGCTLSGIEANSPLFDKMLDKALLTPKEQMADLNISHIFPLTRLCATSNNEKLHQVARHYIQSVTEDTLKNCANSVIFSILPHVSFQINVEQWTHLPGGVREVVGEHANIQQAQRLHDQLPPITHNCVRKI